MEITSELRELAAKLRHEENQGRLATEIGHVANRIDSNHKERISKDNAIIARLEKENVGHFAEIRELHEELEALKNASREGWIELPKDSEGSPYPISDLFSVIEKYTGRIFHTAGIEREDERWVMLYGETAAFLTDRRFSEFTILEAPYDKTGKVIEEGVWVRYARGSAFKVKSVDECTDKSWTIETEDRPYSWRSKYAHHWEIVPAPDSMEKINGRMDELISKLETNELTSAKYVMSEMVELVERTREVTRRECGVE